MKVRAYWPASWSRRLHAELHGLMAKVRRWLDNLLSGALGRA